MRIYIRHAEKAYQNGKSENFIHDPDITSDGREESRALAQNLIKLYGIPKVIISSPFMRCRETALEMLEEVKSDIRLKCDPLISEYLGNHNRVKLDVREDTLIHHPPHPETFVHFECRVRCHNDSMRDFDRSSGVVWIVTHGLVINRIIGCMGYKGNEKLPYLSCFLVRQIGGCRGKIKGKLIKNDKMVALKRY